MNWADKAVGSAAQHQPPSHSTNHHRTAASLAPTHGALAARAHAQRQCKLPLEAISKAARHPTPTRERDAPSSAAKRIIERR